MQCTFANTHDWFYPEDSAKRYCRQCGLIQEQLADSLSNWTSIGYLEPTGLLVQVCALRYLAVALCEELEAVGAWPPTVLTAIPFGDPSLLQMRMHPYWMQPPLEKEWMAKVTQAIDKEIESLKDIFSKDRA